MDALAYAAGLLFLTAASSCQIDASKSSPVETNTISYKLDGASAPTKDAVTAAYLDETVELAGPNTDLFLMSALLDEARPSVPIALIGFNIPAHFDRGMYEPRFSPSPLKDHIWAQYEDNQGSKWFAFRGELKIDEIGKVGGRLRMRFEQLWMTDECGDSHVLEDGLVDVGIASEEFYRQGLPFQTSKRSATVSRAIESNVVFEFVDEAFACNEAIFSPQTNSASVTGTGRDEEVLVLHVQCSCESKRASDREHVDFRLTAFLPPAGEGDVVAKGPLYVAYLSYDVNHTPYVFEDDEVWFATNTEWHYRAAGLAEDDAVDIQSTSTILFVAIDENGEQPTLDPTRTKQLLNLQAYGRVTAGDE